MRVEMTWRTGASKSIKEIVREIESGQSVGTAYQYTVTTFVGGALRGEGAAATR